MVRGSKSKRSPAMGMSVKLPSLKKPRMARKQSTSDHASLNHSSINGMASMTLAEHAPNRKSKFFFDMLMSLDDNILSEYIMPMVLMSSPDSCGCIKEAGIRWLVTMFKTTCLSGEWWDGVWGWKGEIVNSITVPPPRETAGFMKRDIFECLVMSPIRSCPEKWSKTTINIRDYVLLGMLAGKSGGKFECKLGCKEGCRPECKVGAMEMEQLANIVKTMHGNNSPLGLRVEYMQCDSCRWRIYGNTGSACQLSKTSPMGWNCETAARFVSEHAEDLANIGVKIRTITMRGVDTNTFVGRVICDSAREVVAKMGAPTKLHLVDFTAGFLDLERVCGLITMCCKSGITKHMVIDEFTTLGNQRSSGLRPELLEAMVEPGIPCPLTVLRINDCSMSASKSTVIRCARALLRMSLLRDLEIDATPPTSIGLDSTAALLKALGSYMHQFPNATFRSLKRLVLVFGDSSLMSNHMIITTHGTATGATTTALHMEGAGTAQVVAVSESYGSQDSFDEDDDDSSDNGHVNDGHANGEAAVAEIPDPNIAFCLSPEKAPLLECVSLRGTASPISTIKVVAFLRYMLRSRVAHAQDAAQGVVAAKKLKSVIIHARYMPESVTDPASPFRISLNDLTEKFEERHSVGYVPGTPTWGWEAGLHPQYEPWGGEPGV